jgi:hypothetical protein
MRDPIKKLRTERGGPEFFLLTFAALLTLAVVALLCFAVCTSTPPAVIVALSTLTVSLSIIAILVTATILDCRTQLRKLEFALLLEDAEEFKKSQNALVCYSKLGKQLLNVYDSLLRRQQSKR